MGYEIEFEEDAEREFDKLKPFEHRRLRDALALHLLREPMVSARNRKPLRPNPLADWELRVGDLRVLYRVRENKVVIVAIGRKVGNRLRIAGREVQL